MIYAFPFHCALAQLLTSVLAILIDRLARFAVLTTASLPSISRTASAGEIVVTITSPGEESHFAQRCVIDVIPLCTNILSPDAQPMGVIPPMEVTTPALAPRKFTTQINCSLRMNLTHAIGSTGRIVEWRTFKRWLLVATTLLALVLGALQLWK